MTASGIVTLAWQVYKPLFSLRISEKISSPDVEFIRGLPLIGTMFPPYFHSILGGVKRLGTVEAVQVKVIASLQRSATRAVIAMDGTGRGRPVVEKLL